MSNEKKEKQKPKRGFNPGDIKGKIEVTDNRERKDGPGGN